MRVFDARPLGAREIAATTRRNAGCEMCPCPRVTGEPGGSHATMAEARFLRILDELRGEPFERAAICGRCDHARVVDRA